ncbi:MAG: hypothetical protein JWO36_5411 [Myxococcales bacterium]|nr:hypothetical protein [Myxococcales bacterium]
MTLGRALAVAAVRLGDDAGAVLARIGGSIGEQIREARTELARISGTPTRRAEWAAAARAPMPPGLRGVHPTWIEAALAPLPDRARAALAAGSEDPIDVWLARWVCAELPPMPPITNERPASGRFVSVAVVVAQGGDELRAWLEQTGADQLAVVMASAGQQTRATERIAKPPRAGALGPARACIARCRGVVLDELGLLRIGARAIAPYFDALARRQLILRLPRDIGIVVGAELAQAAGDPVDQCPTWTALAAD